jgi:hypothetical protein
VDFLKARRERVPSETPAMRIVADTNTILSGLFWQGRRAACWTWPVRAL